MVTFLCTIMRFMSSHEAWLLGGSRVGLIVGNAHRFENSLVVCLSVVLFDIALHTSLWGHDTPVSPMCANPFEARRMGSTINNNRVR
jgi:hypothetical protein